MICFCAESASLNKSTYFNYVIILLRSEEHTSELQSQPNLVCRLLLEKKKNTQINHQCATVGCTTPSHSTVYLSSGPNSTFIRDIVDVPHDCQSVLSFLYEHVRHVERL